MLARRRRTWSVALALLGGCGPTPGEVVDTGLASPTSSTSAASTGDPPGPTTDGSATVASADGTGTGSSGGPATTMPLDEGTTTSGSSEGSGSTSGGMMESSGDTSTGEIDGCHPLLAEVLYDPQGSNGGAQWIRLYNPCAVDIELLGASMGWGGTNYAINGMDLQGTIAPGGCFLVGGPMSDAENFMPMFDLAMDFSGDLQSSGADADGVALFADVEANVAADTIPVDAVIYGDANTSALLDEEGNTPAPHVGDVSQGQSIRRTALAATWVIEPSPTPNACPAL